MMKSQVEAIMTQNSHSKTMAHTADYFSGFMGIR